MRFLLEVRVPVDEGNEGLMEGTMLKKLNAYLDEIKPECVYFGVKEGQRTLFIVVDIASAEMMPAVAEPLWLDFKADVFFMPVMNKSDFEKAGPHIERIVKARR